MPYRRAMTDDDRPVTVHVSRTDGGFAVERSGMGTTVYGDVWPELPVEENPLLLRGGEQITFDIDPDVRNRVLGTLEAVDELRDRIQVSLEEDGIEGAEESDPVDVGVMVDGEAWGWLMVLGGVSGNDEPLPGGLVPMDFWLGSECVASAGAWMSASMTGIVIRCECHYHHQAGIALHWRWDDIDGYQDVEFEYGLTETEAVSRSFTSPLDEAVCPGCDTGWEIDAGAYVPVPIDKVAEAVSSIWQPCDDHKSDALEVYSASRHWIWAGDRWVANDPTGEPA